MVEDNQDNQEISDKEDTHHSTLYARVYVIVTFLGSLERLRIQVAPPSGTLGHGFVEGVMSIARDSKT